MWKLRNEFSSILIACIVLLTSCQPAPKNASVISTSSPTHGSTATPPPAIPSHIELLTQITIGKINKMALSPDGSRLAVASVSGLYLYQAATLELIWGSVMSAGVAQVVWSGDGNWLGGVIEFNTLLAWDAHTGNLINSLETQTEYVANLQWLPSNDRLSWSASDMIVQIWNPNEELPAEINTAGLISQDMEGGLTSFTPDLSSIAISGSRTISGGDYTIGTVRPLIMIDVATGKSLYTIEDVGLYSIVTFSPDGMLLITGSSIRNPGNGEILRTLEGNPDSVRDITFSPDGTMLSAKAGPQSSKDRVFIWDLATGKVLHVFEGHDDSYQITTTAWSPDGSRFATGSSDKTVIIWDVKSGGMIRRLAGINTEVIQMEFSSDGNTIFVLPEDAHLVAWDVLTGNQLRDIQNVSNIRKLAWSPDSSLLAALVVTDAERVKNVWIWDVKERKVRSVLANAEIPQDFSGRSTGFLEGRLPSSDRKMIASINPYGSQLEILDARTGQVLLSSPIYQSAGKSLAWSPVKSILALTDGTARVLIWNGETGEASELTADHDTFWQVGWSANGALLATSASSNLLIWDTSTWKLFQTLPGSLASNQLVFSPDGKLLATGTWEGIICLWELLP